MFFINEHKIKEHTVVDFFKSQKFKDNIKPQVLKLFKNSSKQPSELKNLFNYQKICDDFSTLQNKYQNKKELNKYSSYIGKWSEIFFELSIDLYQKDKNLFENPETWNIPLEYDELNKDNHINHTLIETKKHFKIKSKDITLFFYDEEDMLKNTCDIEKTYMSFLLQDNREYFQLVINHFKKIIPYFENLYSWNKFTCLYSEFFHEKYENKCEITNWEFDFYDAKNKCIIDLKFYQKTKWNNDWIWQLLLYVYVLDFYYQIKAENIKILNTYAGEEWTAKLSDIFIKNGVEKFFNICKTEISDQQKKILTNRVLSCFSDSENTDDKLYDIVSQNFFTSDKKEIEKYMSFFKQIKCFRNNATFFSDVHSEKWIWQQWKIFDNKI